MADVRDEDADLDKQLQQLDLDLDNSLPHQKYVESPVSHEGLAGRAGWKDAFSEAKLKHALQEVKHFAGGLVPHPYEATKHYAILRHSPWLIYYFGPSTNVVITIFSDRPLPADRTLWLQKRGLSGNVGMNVKARTRIRSSWIEVTPSIDTTADLLPAQSERAWQRDIAKFLKQAKTQKALANHRPYETDIIRIPHAAEDGYFRIVLCAGKTILCTSPVFRYASSSLDPSTLRGASLSSLPLELGIKVGSLVARHTASNAAAGILQPVTSAVQNATQPYRLGGLTQVAATTAYDASGTAARVDDTIDAVNQQYDTKRELDLSAVAGGVGPGDEVFGGVDGPLPPYPIRFSGRVAHHSVEQSSRYPISTAVLGGVNEDTLLRMSGVYMGWVFVSYSNRSSPSMAQPSEAVKLDNTWQYAVITVKPMERQQASAVWKKHVIVHIRDNLDEIVLLDAKMKVMVMAFLRGLEGPSIESTSEDEIQHDIAATEATLSRPAWAPEMVLERIKTDSSNRSLTQRLADARSAAQKRVDTVPVHMLGVRTNSGGLKDQLIGRGGVCIKR